MTSVKRPRIVADNKIPYLQGRLEPYCDVEYIAPWEFTPERIAGADALLVRTRTRCNASLLDGAAPKLIATATIGYDHIDRSYCAARGITVANAAGCNAPGVAQYVWSVLLRGGFDPEKMTLGVVGCGNVGSLVAQWAQRLGCKVIVNDPPRTERGEATGFEEVSLDELLRRSDAVTLHTLLTRDGAHPSWHLIGSREVALMRPGAILVNAARGPVIDTEAVADAVESGAIRAMIDTWEGEPSVNARLLRLAQVATPHIAGYSRQGKERAARMTVESVARTFGIPADTEGLAPVYTPDEHLTPTSIVDSYDPRPLTALLKENPESFERLREDTPYRDEVR